MKKLIVTLSIATAAVAASLAVAGPGYGPGAGMGTGCTATDAAATCTGGAGMGMGPGAGMRGGRGHGMGYGRELMTVEERTAHRNQMMSLKTLDECNSYLAAHHAEMVARATAKGITLPAPRANACERMQAHGRFG